MAVGKKVISAFSGPADVQSFNMITHIPSSQTIKAKKTPERHELEGLYENVRNIREGKSTHLSLEDTFGKLLENHPKDWLLSVEIVELVQAKDTVLSSKIISHLESLKNSRPEVKKLISNGLELIFEKESV